MQLRRILGRAPVTISERATIRESIDLLAEEGIGALVVAEGSKCYGIVTERDMICALADGTDMGDMLRDVVVLEPYSLDIHDTVDDAAAFMRDNSIRHLLVTEEGSLMGVVSIRDLVAGLLQERGETAERLFDVVGPLVAEETAATTEVAESAADGG